MGHEEVDNAFGVYRAGFCTCTRRERIIQQMGPHFGSFILDRRRAGVGAFRKMNQQR